MTGRTGFDAILGWRGLALITLILVFCCLCASVSEAYKSLALPFFAGLAFAGSFLLSLALVVGTKARRPQ